jgi:nitronate monooxygenase
MLGPPALDDELARFVALSTGPLNLNFFCHTPPEPDAVREQRWRALLAPYAQAWGVVLPPPAPPTRQPFDAAMAEVLANPSGGRPPRVVSFHFGLPTPPLLARVKALGVCVMASATTVDEALWLQAQGADVVIAQGLEAGGHRGHFLSDDLGLQRPLHQLLPAVVAAVRVPVIAAGGLATAADVAAALAAGAAGVQVGSAYLRADEATTSAVHRAALASPAAHDTALTHLFSGRPARGIVNRLMRELGPLREGRDDVPAFPLASTALAPLRAAAEAQGLADFTPLWAGQRAGTGLAAPAADITRALLRAFA